MARPDTISTTKLDGGSVTYNLGLNRKLNGDSSLRRTWIVLNDAGCPLQLSGAGIKPDEQYSGETFTFRATGSVKATKSIRAFDVSFVIYDVFGEPLRTWTARAIVDLAEGATRSLAAHNDFWNGTVNDVSMLTTVAFVSRVRMADGQIWHFDAPQIEELLGKLQLKATSIPEASEKGK
jgi:hypothetical protein